MTSAVGFQFYSLGSLVHPKSTIMHTFVQLMEIVKDTPITPPQRDSLIRTISPLFRKMVSYKLIWMSLKNMIETKYYQGSMDAKNITEHLSLGLSAISRSQEVKRYVMLRYYLM